MPLAATFVVAAFSWLHRLMQAHLRFALPWLALPALMLAGDVAWILKVEPFGKNERKRVTRLATLLHLADPGEYVLDLKGDTIFRPRPSYLVLESLTRAQIQNGRLQDDTIPRMIATRTAVVNYSDRFMPATKQFIAQNYVHVQNARVLGQRLQTTPNQPLSFEIRIPENYVLISSKGLVEGTIDGQAIHGPRWLDAGEHTVVVTNHTGETSIVWARAWERGFSPYVTFDPRDGE
jgi:hypothetical protein